MTEIELKYVVTRPRVLESFLSNGTHHPIVRTVDVYLDDEDSSLFRSGIFVRIREGKRLEFKFNPDDVVRIRITRQRSSGFDPKDYKHVIAEEPSFDLPLQERDIPRLNNELQFLAMKKLNKGRATFNEFLKLNRLKEFVVIDKTRKTVIKGPFTFSVDSVKGLGEFVEIECQEDNPSRIDSCVANIQSIANKLKLKEFKKQTGYVELYLRKCNYQLYRQGLYLLEEDIT